MLWDEVAILYKRQSLHLTAGGTPSDPPPLVIVSPVLPLLMVARALDPELEPGV